MALSTGALVVFALIAVALLFFVTEWLSPDIPPSACSSRSPCSNPRRVSAGAALRGFASPADVTLLDMSVLSGAIEETGVLAWLWSQLGRPTAGRERPPLGATVETTGRAVIDGV